jgi:hypothetical protein
LNSRPIIGGVNLLEFGFGGKGFTGLFSSRLNGFGAEASDSVGRDFSGIRNLVLQEFSGNRLFF